MINNKILENFLSNIFTFLFHRIFFSFTRNVWYYRLIDLLREIVSFAKSLSRYYVTNDTRNQMRAILWIDGDVGQRADHSLKQSSDSLRHADTGCKLDSRAVRRRWVTINYRDSAQPSLGKAPLTSSPHDSVVVPVIFHPCIGGMGARAGRLAACISRDFAF